MPGQHITVAIATAGRPGILAETIDHLANQTRRPDRVLVCPARPEDVDAGRFSGAALECGVVTGARGLPSQRNALLVAAWSSDLVVFFDDDFLPENRFLERAEALFLGHADIVAATGNVLVDGILGPGISVADGKAHLDAAPPLEGERILDVHNVYGCNMAFRMAPVRALELRFDEALPLYGWLEDVDFSRRLAPAGRIVQASGLRGVHLGNKGGRSSGVRLGYSQVANPLYMVRKGTLARERAYKQIGRNLLANAVRTLRPEPWVDRRGRLAGNVRAAFDAIRGRLHPGRILDMR